MSLDVKSQALEVRNLIEVADTRALQDEVRRRVTKLIEWGIPLTKLAEYLGLDMAMDSTSASQLAIEKELQKKFPPLKEEEVIVVTRHALTENDEPDENVTVHTYNLPKSIHIETVGETFVPPDDIEMVMGNGDGEVKKPEVFPRTELAISVLEGIEGVDMSTVRVLKGVNRDNMMRGLSYVAIVVPSINRSMLVCDEEGNRTFVIYSSEAIESFYRLRKSGLKELIDEGEVADLVWCDSEEWKVKLAGLLMREPEVSEVIVKPESESAKVEVVPEGWMTNGRLAKELGATRPNIKKIADEYRTSNPKWFKKYRHSSIKRSYEYYSPELVKIITYEVNKYEKAPKGWMTLRMLEKKLEIDKSPIKKIADEYRESNPEWLKRYRHAKVGQILEHYSPELVQIITDEVDKYGVAPEGWMTCGGLTKELNFAQRSIKKIADEYSESNPEWFKDFIATSGHMHTHYAPELVQIITDEVNKYEKAPDKWMNALQISKMLKISRNKTQNLADEHRSSNPEWFKDCRPRTGPVCEYFAPELIQIIINEIDKYEKVPDEWMTNNAVAENLGTNDYVVKIIADEYIESNPEWFNEYIAESGHIYEFYSPKLIMEIEKRKNDIDKATEGFMNNFAVAKLLQVSRSRVKYIAERHRKEHPEWFARGMSSSSGQGYELYSPDLVKIITKECKKHTDAPKGWLTITSMSRQIGVSPSYVASIIGKYSDTHPKWIQEYWGKSGGVRLHYSPALIKIVTDDIDSQQEAPEGWITNSSLAKDIGIDYYIAKEKADKHRGAHPTWFKEYKNVQSKFIEHYSPELIAAIREELA